MNNKFRKEIEQLFSLNIIDEQYFPWGESYFLELEPSESKNNSRSRRSISIVTVYPDVEQKIHTHPGYDEIIYGLEGETIHWSNSHKIILGKGRLGYIPAGGQHIMANISGKPARFMSIVYPTIPDSLGEISAIEDVELPELAKMTNLDAIASKFTQNIKLAVSLVDTAGNLLTEPKNFPVFCKLCLTEQLGDCVLYSEGRIHAGKDLRVCSCKFGVYSVQSPIIFNERLLGYLGCGYGRVSMVTPRDEILIKKCFPAKKYYLAQKEYHNLEFINRNHLKSVAEILSLISASLVQLIIQSTREKQISMYKLSLTREKQIQAELENRLNEAKLRFLESQVNPHFLFNTLNTIAQTSLMEGATTAASLTYALANLLRSSLGKTDPLITIREELNYIQDYLLIQKTRFPSRFTVEMDIKVEVLEIKIPIMTIMVLVENSIIHGFSNIRWPGSLQINAYSEQHMAVIEVIDNGSGVPPQVIENVKSLKGIGLKNIYKRLEFYYGDKFTFDIKRLDNKGTKVTIKLPCNM